MTGVQTCALPISGVLAACQAQRMGVLNIRVFAGGSLASPVRHGREFVMASGSDLDSEARRAAALQDVLGAQHGSPAQRAVRFCLGEDRIATCVTGMAEPAHLDEVLAAVQRGCLPAETAPALQALWDADFGFAA